MNIFNKLSMVSMTFLITTTSILCGCGSRNGNTEDATKSHYELLEKEFDDVADSLTDDKVKKIYEAGISKAKEIYSEKNDDSLAVDSSVYSWKSWNDDWNLYVTIKGNVYAKINKKEHKLELEWDQPILKYDYDSEQYEDLNLISNFTTDAVKNLRLRDPESWACPVIISQPSYDSQSDEDEDDEGEYPYRLHPDY